MGTHYKGNKQEIAALSAFINLIRAADSMLSRAVRLMEADGLSHCQFAVLEVLYHLGPMRQHELASKILRSPGNITFVLDKLETAKLVQRKKESSDRRCFMIVLTPLGRKKISAIFPEHVKNLTKEMASLSIEELGVLRSLCRKVGKGE